MLRKVLKHISVRKRWGLRRGNGSCAEGTGYDAAVISTCATVVFLGLLIAEPTAVAQTTARISGLVHDQSGAVIPNASVILRDEASGTELRRVTEDSGFYSLDPVPPKTYTLEVSSPGFKTYRRTGIEVHAADRLDWSVTLEVGDQRQQVEVTATTELVPTNTRAKVEVLTATQIQNLSTMGRNALELLGLLAGVVDQGFDPSQGSSLNQGMAKYSINGLSYDQNDYHIDGARGIEPGGFSSVFVVPNMDMIQEFSAKTSNVEADQGRSPVNIDVVTKSGGKDYHGSLYYYGRNAVFNANDFSNNLAGVRKPGSKFNYPGFTIGGPVRIPGTNFNKNRDKLFFFVGMEWQRQLPDLGTTLATVPSTKMRAGDFSELLNPQFCQTDGTGNVTGGRYLNMPCLLHNPNDGSVLPGNILPDSAITRNGRIFLDLFPLPNHVDKEGGRYNFAARNLYPLNPFVTTIKVDYDLSERTRMFVRLSRQAEEQLWPYGLWGGPNSGWTSNIPEPGLAFGENHSRALALNLVQVLNPKLTNEVQFSAQGLYYPNKYKFPEKVSKSALGFNFKGMTFPGVPPQSDTVPQITDQWSYYGGNPGAGRWGAGNLANTLFYKSTEFEFFDNLSKVSGTHILKFGFALERSRQHGNGGGNLTEGLLVTDSTWGSTTGNEFGDILSERYKAYSQISRAPVVQIRSWNIEWFAQDSWKVSQRLTLNYGARFSWMQPWQILNGFLVTFDRKVYDPAQPTSFANGLLLSSKGEISNSTFGDTRPVIQPRVGFAWDIFGTGKSVLRSGFGTYVSRMDSNNVFPIGNAPPNTFTTNPTFGNSVSLAEIERTDPFGSVGNISLGLTNVHDNQTPQSYQWSLTWSQNIGLQTVLETSYVGNVSRHQPRARDINAVPLGAMWLPGTQTLGPDTTSQHFRPFQPWGTISAFDQSQNSNYNSLQVTARRNVTKGLTLLTVYTWSKSLGVESADPFDLRLGYRLLSRDRAHNLAFSYIYQLPSLGAKSNRAAKGVLDGWRLSGITHYTSGVPLTIFNGGIYCVNAPGEKNPASLDLCTNFIGDGRFWYGTDARGILPLILSNPQDGVSSTGVNKTWINPASVTIPAIGQYGNFAQPTYRSPASNRWDLTLFKEFRLREKARLQFRWAAFNVFNRARLDIPNTTAQFNWNLPLGATTLSRGSASLANPDSFGKITNKHGHREMEYGIKILF